ncbi:hypothetical protein EBU95_20670 [bacterium]|nr:hypothetical protein [bacterium]
MSILLIILYPIAIQYERGGIWNILLPITFITLLIDVIANYTELALLTLDFPQSGEYTFSDRLVRIQYAEGWTGFIGRNVAAYCNYWAPNHNHIPF